MRGDNQHGVHCHLLTWPVFLEKMTRLVNERLSGGFLKSSYLRDTANKRNEWRATHALRL